MDIDLLGVDGYGDMNACSPSYALSATDAKIVQIRERSGRHFEGEVEAGIKGSFGGGKGFEMKGYAGGSIQHQNGMQYRGEVSGNTKDGVEYDLGVSKEFSRKNQGPKDRY